MVHDIFISYSSVDKAIADAVCAALEANSMRCWIAPRDILPGKEWGEEIVEAISVSKIMVLIFSSAANKSQQVLREVERAVNKNVIIIPFRIEDVLPTKSMEYFLYSTHWLDALSPNLEIHIERLVETTSTLIKAVDKSSAKGNKNEKSPLTLQANNKQNVLIPALLIISITVVIIFGMYIFGGKKSDNVEQSSNTNNKETLADTNNEQNVEQENITQLANTEDIDIEYLETMKPETTELTTKDNNEESKEQEETTDNPNDYSTNKPTNTQQPEIVQLKVGDYIQFGTYYGEKISWRIINIDSSGKILLFSTNIISLKPFDAAEGPKYNQTKDGLTYDYKAEYTLEQFRMMKGSNNWANSNIREWLNSDAQTVNFTTNPPSSNYLIYDQNTYSKEPGFLSNFTQEEKNMILPVKQKVIVSELEQTKNEGGSELYQFKAGNLSDALSNYNVAYYQFTIDKVFLLSVKEINDYVVSRGWSYETTSTPEALEHDQSNWYKELHYKPEDNWCYWLRTPNASTGEGVCIVDQEGNISSSMASGVGVGVRPALYITQPSVWMSGTGIQEDPYILMPEER